MKVLLVSVNQEKRFGATTPLGVGYVAAAARAAGHEVQLLDLCFEDDNARVIREKIASWPPDAMGISVRNIDNTIYLAPVSYISHLKEVVDLHRGLTDAPIILGGAGFSLFPEALLNYCDLSFGIVGEGEVAFPRLLAMLERGEDFRSLPGLAWLEEGSFRQNLPVRISDLDALPWPARDLFDARYRIQQEPPAVGNIESKRGCRFHCIYCTYPLIQGRSCRLRSPGQVAKEMAWLEANSGLLRVDFVDNVFNNPPGHALEVCRELIRQNVRLPWGCSIRPDNLSSELISAMGRAGCRWLEIGADSASDRMLRLLGKGFETADLRRAMALLRDSGMETACYILVGGPGETAETLQETLENLEKLDPAWVYLMPGLRVYPGTPLANMVLKTRETEAELLAGTFYFSPELGDSGLELLCRRAEEHENWIVLGGNLG